MNPTDRKRLVNAITEAAGPWCGPGKVHEIADAVEPFCRPQSKVMVVLGYTVAWSITGGVLAGLVVGLLWLGRTALVS